MCCACGSVTLLNLTSESAARFPNQLYISCADAHKKPGSNFAHVWTLVDARAAIQLAVRAANQELPCQQFYTLLIQFSPLLLELPSLHVREPRTASVSKRTAPSTQKLSSTSPAPRSSRLHIDLLCIAALGLILISPFYVHVALLIALTLKAFYSRLSPIRA